MGRKISNIFSLLKDNPVFNLLNSFDEAYLVGGAVRDYLLKREIKDYDFVVKEEDFEVLKSFALKEKLPHFILNAKNLEFLRIIFPEYTLDFTKLTDPLKVDIEKRDFTINSIYVNVKSPEIVLHKGFSDIKDGIIKTVNENSINDDPIRIFRAIRLANSLNFKIDEGTIREMLKAVPLLYKVKKERAREEVKKILNTSIINLFVMLGDIFKKDFHEEIERFKIAKKFPELKREINQDVSYIDLFIVSLISAKIPFFSCCFEGKERDIIGRILNIDFKDRFEDLFEIFVSNRDKKIPILIALFKANIEKSEKIGKMLLSWSKIRISGSEIEKFSKKNGISKKQARFSILKERCSKSEV